MPLPEIPPYSRGLLPYLRPIVPRASGAPLPYSAEYDPSLVARMPLSGRPYLRLRPPLAMPPGRAIWTGERWELVCPWPGCFWHHPSGIALRAHWTRTHQSVNDPDVLVPGPLGLNPQLFRARDWHAGGPISDVAGQVDRVRSAGLRPWDQSVRGYECRKENTARFARKLDRRR